MNHKTQFPVYYDEIDGWMVLSDETIPGQMLLSMRDYVYKVNSQRLKGVIGDKKEYIERALKRLLLEGIRVRSSKPGMTLFQSTEKVGSKSYHFMN